MLYAEKFYTREIFLRGEEDYLLYLKTDVLTYCLNKLGLNESFLETTVHILAENKRNAFP